MNLFSELKPAWKQLNWGKKKKNHHEYRRCFSCKHCL